jgi:hypothetical protein
MTRRLEVDGTHLVELSEDVEDFSVYFRSQYDNAARSSRAISHVSGELKTNFQEITSASIIRLNVMHQMLHKGKKR